MCEAVLIGTERELIFAVGNKKVGNNRFNNHENKLGMVAHAYNSTLKNGRQEGCCEFEANLGSIVNTRPAKATLLDYYRKPRGLKHCS